MNNENTTATTTATTAAKVEQPDFVKTIGKTAYKVKLHFSKTSEETMTDKIFRLLRNEVSQSPKT